MISNLFPTTSIVDNLNVTLLPPTITPLFNSIETANSLLNESLAVELNKLAFIESL